MAGEGEGNVTMDNLAFGLTLTLIGMGGTFLTLWILSLVIVALKKIFPPGSSGKS